ncbi:DUF4304 domain-containing protein [Flavobacterium marginilacus]|uniref:DUF4304 domain-containing protein n=1 Tax=Flavobacterium marginilacus TaxID=3003256 RepID=UPI00248E2A8E|nr:DUF4304 domain-containing protein [Flavobacterium marginilacus]
MLDINEFINAISKSVEEILETQLNIFQPKNEIEDYKKLISIITFSIIESIDNPINLQEKLIVIENESFTKHLNTEKLKNISILLINAKNQHHFNLYNKARKEKREKITKALKEITIPFLRAKGFKGSFPNFKRNNNNDVHLLRFLFSQFGAQFAVEIAKSNIDNKNISFFNGHRLGSEKNKNDYWYNYENTEITEDIFNFRASEVIENWSEAENWWTEN